MTIFIKFEKKRHCLWQFYPYNKISNGLSIFFPYYTIKFNTATVLDTKKRRIFSLFSVKYYFWSNRKLFFFFLRKKENRYCFLIWERFSRPSSATDDLHNAWDVSNKDVWMQSDEENVECTWQIETDRYVYLGHVKYDKVSWPSAKKNSPYNSVGMEKISPQ